MRLIPEKSVLLGFYTDGPKMRNLTWKVPVFQIFTFLYFIIAYECGDEEIFAELFRRAHLHLINSWNNFLNVHLIFLLQTIYSEYSLQYANEIFDHFFIKTAISTVTMLHLHRVKKLEEWKGGGSERWYSGLRLADISLTKEGDCQSRCWYWLPPLTRLTRDYARLDYRMPLK